MQKRSSGKRTKQQSAIILGKMNEKKPCYIWDEKLIEECDRLPAVTGRASVVHCLIEAYHFLDRITVVRSSPAKYQDMREFHSELYLDYLKGFIDVDDDYMSSAQDEEYGIGYDCPPVSNMFELVSSIAGGSITAARCLLLGITDVAINWCGGWHHAHRSKAEGFCYINDIVIAIKNLRKKFSKILYIDLDVHHGNGVQDAFSLSKSVFTLSFHKFEPGFYPGTGDLNDIGAQDGTGYHCNFPFNAAYCDDTMEYCFEKVFNSVYDHFKPDAVVVQCGADALAHDPNGGANLTTRSYCRCVRRVLDKRKPTLLLGGGGYKHENAARLWTSLTALVAEVELDEQIPEHSHWPQYCPHYTLAVDPTLTKDSNSICYIENCVNKINGHLVQYLGQPLTEEPLVKRMKTYLACNSLQKTNTGIIIAKCDKKNSYTIQREEKIVASEQKISKECNSSNLGDVYEFID